MSEQGRIARKFLIDGSTDRVVLFSWAVDTARLKRNVARVDERGDVVWRAELPHAAASDCFISLERAADGFIARTYREWVVHLNDDGETTRAERESPMT